ncbi:hypothetical protein [Streptomyces sp. NPDC021562]|uniref:hypothetical protein n=1 Tax=Streptomyces sp. NPDC021562 TaxID=3155121 RepID=UPI0033EC4153
MPAAVKVQSVVPVTVAAVPSVTFAATWPGVHVAAVGLLPGVAGHRSPVQEGQATPQSCGLQRHWPPGRGERARERSVCGAGAWGSLLAGSGTRAEQGLRSRH